jgi:hypothetical protein
MWTCQKSERHSFSEEEISKSARLETQVFQGGQAHADKGKGKKTTTLKLARVLRF